MPYTLEIVDSLMDEPIAIEIFKVFQDRVLEEQRKREEFYNWISPDVKAEFINGEVIVHSPVKSRHAQASDNVFLILGLYVRKHKLGRMTHEKVMSRFERNDYEPDVMFFNNEKADTIKPTQSLFPVPDFIVEIVSDSTEERDRGIKYDDYERHGVVEYWIIDVENEVIEQYLLKNNKYYLNKKSDEGVIHCQAIKGLDLPIRTIFDEKEHFDFVQKMMN